MATVSMTCPWSGAAHMASESIHAGSIHAGSIILFVVHLTLCRPVGHPDGARVQIQL
jgi:hypothetical protein